MMKTALIYNQATGDVTGTLIVTQDTDLAANLDRAAAQGKGILEVAPDHPAMQSRAYKVLDTGVIHDAREKPYSDPVIY